MQLNKAQLKAVMHKDGPMLVLAGPGSGKTLVITERTKNLIIEQNIPEANILVITFTRAAVAEMKDRFLKAMKSDRTGVNFGTFHAVFFTILKSAYHLNFSNILKEEERIRCLKEIIRGLELTNEEEKDFVTDLLSEISLVKGNRMDLSSYYSISCGEEVFRQIFRDYNRMIRKANKIDFDDMLLLCYELLSQREDIRKLWQEKFRYILIDEFQDINMVQYDIIRMLAQPRNNLFIVGDDDQSIYRFRGAKPEIMLNFPRDYPECKKLLLDINYRSKGRIIRASGQLIGNNRKRYHKELCPVKEEGSHVLIKSFETTALQNKRVVEQILLMNRAGIRLRDIAILVRTNMGSGALLHKLMEYNLPFRMRDMLPNIYEHWIAEDLAAYIKIAGGNQMRSLFLKIINRPKRYISRDCFDSPEVEFEALRDYYEDKEWMAARIEQLEYDLSVLAGMGPFAAINYIRRGIGYEDYLKEYADMRRMNTEELFDILDEIQESARDFKTCEEWFAHMEEYTEELKKQAAENKDADTDSIHIVTMHSSKGLEFQAVFIVDANEGITPHKKAVLEDDIEEERRLFYVAMTRAKEYLYIYSTKERYNKTMKRSRFVDEIEAICEKDQE